MKKGNVLVKSYVKKDGTKVEEHLRTTDKNEAREPGLFDNLNEELAHIFNKVSIRIPGLSIKLLPLKYRVVKCLTEPKNEAAEKIILEEMYTSDLALSYLIAFSPSATPDIIFSQATKFEENQFESRTAFLNVYKKIIFRALNSFENTAKNYVKNNDTGEKFIEMRSALNELSSVDAYYICLLNEMGDLHTSWELLSCLRFIAGMGLSVNEKRLNYVNNIVNIKKGAA